VAEKGTILTGKTKFDLAEFPNSKQKEQDITLNL